MNYEDLKQQTELFFQTSNHPNIFSEDSEIECDLSDVQQKRLSLEASIKVIDGVVNAIICLMTHSLTPSQVKLDQIVKCNGQWGLQAAVCYRTKQFPQQQSNFSYDPAQFEEHPDQESEMMWTLGKIWYLILTNTTVPRAILFQEDSLSSELRSKVDNQKITNLIMGMLNPDSQKRITFQALISSGVLLSCYEADQICLKSSLVNHFHRIHDISYLHHSSKSSNPFLEHIYHRRLEESIVFTPLFEEIKRVIRGQFKEFYPDNQSEFSCEVIDAFRYLHYRELQSTRQREGYNVILLDSRKVYSEFTKTMYALGFQLQKLRKMKKYKKMLQKYPECFVRPDTLNPNAVYGHYKSYLTDYIVHIKKRSKGKLNLETQKTIIKMILLRTIKYVFQTDRTLIFGIFEGEKYLKASSILRSINDCEEISLLKELQNKILNQYMQK